VHVQTVVRLGQLGLKVLSAAVTQLHNVARWPAMLLSASS
jgi:hypothetical protein